ncbi:MAG TPA: hypothetical protein VEC99_13310, partial [Clostridia bacterium]|nr:hypothetical protein [Clostridia bacterium]
TQSIPPTSQSPLACFTAAQISAALGFSKPTVLTALRETPAAGSVIIGGKDVAAWSYDQFPARFKEAVAQTAFRHGLSVADYLESSARPWQPKTPLSQVALAEVEKASQLKRALAVAIERRLRGEISKSEQERLGMIDFKTVFGYQVSAKRWRELLGRTLRRARWDEDFERLEIYLEDKPAVPAADGQKPTQVRDELRPLRSLIEGMIAKGDPDGAQQKQVFDDAFLVLEQLTPAMGASDARREVIGFLQTHAPFLAKTPDALRRNFDRLYSRWTAGGKVLTVLEDQRYGRPRGPELTEEDRVTLIAYSSKYGGGMDQGWREAIRAGKLRPELVEYYRKSPRQMPRKIREQVSGFVKDVKTRMHGPRHAVLKGPYISRDPNHPENPLYSGDWDQSDDYTFVNVMWDTMPDGRIWVGQPQLLLWTDERSWMPLGFVLIPDRNYNAFDIRNSWTTKCDEYGLPRQGLYLEGSFWQTARVWVGRKDEVSWSETEQGIRRLGVRIKRAIYPRGKLIERIFRKVQSFLQAEPGYVGTNPITDRYEEVQKQLRLVKSGQAHPGEFGWLSKAEWKVRLGEIFGIYSNEPGEGKYLDGLSPKQAYERHFSTPLSKIPENCRYLLATNKTEEVVMTPNGLTFHFGSRTYTYKDARFEGMRLEGQQKVIAWFNPENPQFCGVTDKNGENPIVAKLETSVPNHDARPELLRQAYAENAAMQRIGKEVYAKVKQVFSKDFENRRFRPVVMDGQAARLQAEFDRQTKEITAKEKAASDTVRRASRAASDMGLVLSSTARTRPESAAALERLRNLLKEDEA